MGQWQSVLPSSNYTPNFYFSSYSSPRLSFCLRHMAEESDYESLPPNAGLPVSILSFLRKQFFLNLARLTCLPVHLSVLVPSLALDSFVHSSLGWYFRTCCHVPD